MAIVLKGRTNVSDIPNFVTKGTGAEILDIIEMGNSEIVQSTLSILANMLFNA